MASLQLKMLNMASMGKSILEKTLSSCSISKDLTTPIDSKTVSGLAPHPIPAGKEGHVCPISGLFAGCVEGVPLSAKQAWAELEADPDIVQERQSLEADHESSIASAQKAPIAKSIEVVPLNVVRRAHRANADTRRLVQGVGGVSALRRFTGLFYTKAFADPHLDKFIRSHDDPHGERFATWIAEKMGDGTPWTDERRTRPVTHLRIGREVIEVSHDRSSAHFAAWNSPKREPHKRGEHFKPDDARVWMRLHFWAAREAGMFETEAGCAFMEYYTRFIGHFISVYSSKSPPFTRESLRWSADPQNIQRYLAAGNVMEDVIDKSIDAELAKLPPAERVYTGSGVLNAAWPYEVPPLA
jgi:hypothetical protein